MLRRYISVLGHIITPEEVAVNPSMIHDVMEWPIPQRLKDLRSSLGLCSYYRRFICDVSVLAALLFALTRKGKAFIWDEECQEELEYLKPVLTTTLILDLPQDEGTYVPDSNACDEGIGPVLSQKINGEGTSYCLRESHLSNTERNYCVTRKELLAVVYFTELSRQHLLGRKFVLRTHFATLQWLQRTPEPIGHQGRWLDRLAEFQFQVLRRSVMGMLTHCPVGRVVSVNGKM